MNIYLLSSPPAQPDSSFWIFMIISLGGGLALFLYGMEKMSNGLRKSSGLGLNRILKKLTGNRFIGLATGAFVTMIIQSSSATTVMLVGIVQAGLLNFSQTISIILGANIGTTVTAQVIAFKLTDYSLLMIIIGFAVISLAKTETYKYMGESLLGFGLLFLGIKFMSDAMIPLREYEPLLQMMHNLKHPLLGLLVGIIFTALIQSSSAFTGIVIVLAQQGLIGLEAGIPMLLGANIGTCITAILSSLRATREAKRVALTHVIFNLVGSLIFLFWIPAFADIVRMVSPASNLEGIAGIAAEAPRQIANAHTLFNVSVGLLFLPFTGLIAILVLKIIPVIDSEKTFELKTKYLDKSALKTPYLAIDLTKAELGRMAKLLRRMLEGIKRSLLTGEAGVDETHKDLTIIQGIELREEKIDYLEKEITAYLIMLGRENLTQNQSREVFELISIVREMEAIGDIIHHNMFPLIAKKSSKKINFSAEGKEDIINYQKKIFNQLVRLEELFSQKKLSRGEKILSKSEAYKDMDKGYRKRHLERVHQEKKESIETHEMHMEIMDYLRQINSYVMEIALSMVKFSEKEPQ